MAQIWDYGRPFMPRRRSKKVLATITSVIAATVLLIGLMPAAFASGALDVTVYVQDKTYDGGTSATISVCVVDGTNLDGTDTASCDLGATSASFATKDVGPSKTVNASVTLQFGGANTGGPYTLGTVTAMPAAITAGPTVAVTVHISNKTYDGNTTATISSCDATQTNVIGADTVTCSTSGVTANFATKSVGSGKTVNLTGTPTLSGADGGNYTLGTVTVDNADITASSTVDVTVHVANKTYDGTTTATITGCDADQTNVVSPDVVTCDYSGVTAANFADADVDTDKTVNLTGTVALGGSEAGNYTLGTVDVDTADITGPTVAYNGTTYTVITSGSTAPVILDGVGGNEGICAGSVVLEYFVKDITDATVHFGPAATLDLPTGIYTVTVYHGTDPFDANCNAIDSAVITVVSAGGSTNGGGWYRRGDYSGDGSSRANFGLVLNKTYTGTGKNKTWSGYKGDFVWVSGQGWRIKARVSGGTSFFGTYTCPGTVGTGTSAACGSFQVTGATLEKWDPELNGGLGDWAVYDDDITFTVTIYDGGSVTVCKKKLCTKTEVADWFGIQISGYSSSEVPTTSPVKLVQPAGKGSIKVLP